MGASHRRKKHTHTPRPTAPPPHNNHHPTHAARGDTLSDLPVLGFPNGHDLAIYERLWARWPKQWLALVKLAIKRQIKESRGGQEGVLEDPYPLPPPSVRCEDYDAAFETSRGLATHKRRVHGVTSWMHGRIAGTICQACGKQFWSEWRLRRQIERGSLKCSLKARLGDWQPPTADEVAEAAIKLARRAAKKAGTSPDEAVFPAVPLATAITAISMMT